MQAKVWIYLITIKYKNHVISNIVRDLIRAIKRLWRIRFFHYVQENSSPRTSSK
jgi:hypothetical protein